MDDWVEEDSLERFVCDVIDAPTKSHLLNATEQLDNAILNADLAKTLDKAGSVEECDG